MDLLLSEQFGIPFVDIQLPRLRRRTRESVYNAERLSIAGEFDFNYAVSCAFPEKIFYHALLVFRPSMINYGRLDALRVETKNCPPDTILSLIHISEPTRRTPTS